VARKVQYYFARREVVIADAGAGTRQVHPGTGQLKETLVEAIFVDSAVAVAVVAVAAVAAAAAAAAAVVVVVVVVVVFVVVVVVVVVVVFVVVVASTVSEDVPVSLFVLVPSILLSVFAPVGWLRVVLVSTALGPRTHSAIVLVFLVAMHGMILWSQPGRG
jgi:hypothetical protein